MHSPFHLSAVFATLLFITAGSSFAAKISDIANTKHNLSATPYPSGATEDRTVIATSETQICVFCHTPHKAQNIPDAPLWNRALAADGSYTPYASDSLDAGTLGQPDGSSKLCLSCHDGTMAIGSVGVINGVENTAVGVTVNIDMGSTVNMPAGGGTTSGHTRDLGTILTNDHPISFKYNYDPANSTLAQADGELIEPLISANGYIANRVPGATRPDVPLENDKLQCTSCHDPHIRETDAALGNAKFLRLNRFQQTAPAGTAFDSGKDIVCLACHKKEGWDFSTHAQSTSTYTLLSDAVTNGDFPQDLPVWKAACLNCHDTHTVQGATRLLRGGVDGSGLAAQEETCYQCHNDLATTSAVTPAAPDVGQDFANTIHMPISSTDLGGAAETHTIVKDADLDAEVVASKPAPYQLGKDLIESKANLGNKRHAECTDCHNPHRVMKNAQFDGGGISTQSTHLHVTTATHTNEASGALTGTWGVEPTYPASCGTSANWDTCDPLTISYEVRRGAYTNATTTPVDKEYQVCLKCHSSYAYGATPPSLGTNGGGTPTLTNGMTQYTDQAKEFQGNQTGEPGGNHSSWHPVRIATGRDTTARGNLDPTNFNAPWNNTTPNSIGSQTMYCTDCHGSNTTSATSVVPDGGEVTGGDVWGPHGSSNNFILKGAWDTAGVVPDSNGLCFKCHNKDAYSPATLPATYPQSGFSCVNCLGGGGGNGNAACNMNAGSEPNLHIGHKQLVGELRCSWCHTAVPHGWKNKALLVNVGLDAGTTATPVQQAPYYQNAMLGGNATTGITFATSGNWIDTDCGGGGAGGGWMNNSCNAPP